MTVHLSPSIFVERESLVAWRTKYPRFSAMIDEGAHPTAVLRCLGLALWRDSYLDNAATVLRAAAEITPNDPMIFAELGSVLSGLGHVSEAMDCLTASLKLDAHQPVVWLSIAGLCTRTGDAAMAEQAFEASLEIDPRSAEAATGLGLLCMEQRRYAEAARHLSRAIAEGADTTALQACLGQAHYLAGDFAGASRALDKAVRACPNEARLVQRYAMARLLEALIAGPVLPALALYRSVAGPHAEAIDTACRAAFQILCCFGHAEAAARVGDALLETTPGDPVVRYHLDALAGCALDRAPAGYVAACFDAYAADFERHLTEVLDYRLPGELPGLLAEAPEAFAHILDLGCGTGLAAPVLARPGARLTGVDLSPKMLEQAQARGCYDRLETADALTFLEGSDERFDLIVALDVLGYFGDLAPLFEAVASRLAPGGMFAFSIEAGNAADFALQPCGRFIHAPAYVERLAARRFHTVASRDTIMRLEANAPVAGRMLLLQRD